MAINSNIVFDVPGVYVTEDTFGAVPASLASFGTVYMLGFSSKAGAPVDTIQYVTSLDDFTNIFGASASAASVDLFFKQRSGSGLYFVNVGRRSSRRASISTVTPGDTYSLSFNGGSTVSVVALAGETPAQLTARLANEVNLRLPGVAYMLGDRVNYTQGVVVTATTNIGLAVETLPGAIPTGYDIAHTIAAAFDPEMKQGYLIAPEFFQTINDEANRTILGQAMEAHCSDPDYNWMALIDASTIRATGNPVGMINNALYESGLYSSPKGHSAYFFPYWLNELKAPVPMSASVAGVALRAYRQKGFTQPPAGVTLPVYGVVDTTFNISNKVQAVLNPVGVNCGRRLPNRRGIVIYGSRTLSRNPYYKFMTTRVIMNVLAGTLRNAFDEFVFSSVDGLGVTFSRIKLTCVSICETLRKSGALYGATPEEAYLVVCDDTNNPAFDLENGKVVVDVVVKPSPILEALQVRLSRAALGTNLQETVASGLTSPPSNIVADPQPNG